MKKKVLAIVLCVAMLAIAIVGGTMAYFTDSEQVTNTMVIGNVKIDIEERTYDYAGGTGWNDFGTVPFKLYPVKTDDWNARMKTNQLHNKVVNTFNTSPSGDPVYIRTIIAVEHIDSNNQWNSAVGLGFDDNKCKYNVAPIVMNINDKVYDVYICTAADEKPIEKDASLQTLQSVWLYDNVTQAEVAAAENLEILVLSQGIQSAGLTHEAAMEALGEINRTNLELWLAQAREAYINGIV